MQASPKRRAGVRLALCTALLLSTFFLSSDTTRAEGGVAFTDLAAGGGAGLTYTRAPSARLALLNGFYADGFFNVAEEYIIAPFKPHGAPGLALFDHDGDGDLDLYVTNGPGRANSLFSNQLVETGTVAFIDVAVAAGVAATDQDSQGVCFGDIDNDGDEDLYVLGHAAPNRLFENRGDGTFTDITALSGAGGGNRTSTSCATGDVDGDGLLDIAVANAYDFTQMFPFTIDPLGITEHNQLFLNTGANIFADVSAAAGLENIIGIPVPGAAITDWAVSLVDYDQDGDADILFSEDGRAFTGADQTGFNRLYQNDGTGTFTDVTAASGLARNGVWKGQSWGDLDCDGSLDFFATNFGDYIFFPGFFLPGAYSSAWFLQGPGGTFTSPGPGSLVTVPLGWGNSLFDYDNDGDLDIVFYGGQDNTLFIDESNPGIILSNQGCSASFSWDQAALAGSTNHLSRNVEGLAVGDLDGDGFPDIVSVSGFDLPADAPLAPMFSNPLGSVFDPTALGIYSTVPTMDPNLFQVLWNAPVEGTLAVEINSGGNGNRAVRVETLGTAGLIAGGSVNRDGIGAVVAFTPAPGLPGTTVTRPVAGGGSYASQDALALLFGAGDALRGSVDVLWPGGVRNRLYGVRAGEQLLFPEIPCSYSGDQANLGSYLGCVLGALDELENQGILSHQNRGRFLVSAVHAYLSARGLPF